MTHLGASGGLICQQFCIRVYSVRHILGHILTFSYPPANPVKRKSPKWLLQVYRIKYYIFKVGLAPLGSILGPLRSVLVLFRAFRVTFLLGENTLCCFYGILKCQKNPSFENTAKILNSTFCYYVCLWCRKSQNTENTGGVFVVWTLHRIAGCGAQKPGIPTTLS